RLFRAIGPATGLANTLLPFRVKASSAIALEASGSPSATRARRRPRDPATLTDPAFTPRTAAALNPGRFGRSGSSTPVASRVGLPARLPDIGGSHAQNLFRSSNGHGIRGPRRRGARGAIAGGGRAVDRRG